MYTKPKFRAFDLAWWTRFDAFRFLLIIVAWVATWHFLDVTWLQIPWTPLALIGTAVAFLIGFQNNASYDRLWEARKIWGGIVNSSRTFGMFVQDMVSNEHAQTPLADEELADEVRTLTYRHIAWMTALRHAMRAARPWETTSRHKTNREWEIQPPEWDESLEEQLGPLLSDDDLAAATKLGNVPTALLYQQSHHLRRLKEQGVVWEFSFLELEALLRELFTLQGKSERIKNFPYPRQYATLNHFFMWIFVLLLPMALVPQFAELGQKLTESHPAIAPWFVWASVPFYVAVAWVFHTMERIGRTGDNPFEGTSNDVPISTIARGIEIDLRQNLGESDEQIPGPLAEQHDTQF